MTCTILKTFIFPILSKIIISNDAFDNGIIYRRIGSTNIKKKSGKRDPLKALNDFLDVIQHIFDADKNG